MKKSWVVASLILITISLVLAACKSFSPTPSFVPSPVPSATFLLVPSPTLTISLPTPSPTPWPLKIEFADRADLAKPSCEQVLQLKPGVSALQDVYDLLGYPSRARDLPMGIALGYPSRHIKFKHVILVDGVDGTVLLVGAVVYDDRGCPSFEDLKTQYGQPLLATTNGNRRHWFFDGKDIADTGMVLQLLPQGTTLEQYRSHQGYIWESYAFTP